MFIVTCNWLYTMWQKIHPILLLHGSNFYRVSDALGDQNDL